VGASTTFGERVWDGGADQMKFIPRYQLPLDLLARLHVDGHGQGNRKGHVQPLGSALGSNHLNFNRVFGLHVERLGYSIAFVNIEM
jgi:hypothetical protein